MATAATNRDSGVRADLARRIEAVDRYADQWRPCEIANELDHIRRTAFAAGLAPALTVIHAIDEALSRGERGPLVHGWLAILRDAVDCQQSDANSCETYAAACSVRLNG